MMVDTPTGANVSASGASACAAKTARSAGEVAGASGSGKGAPQQTEGGRAAGVGAEGEARDRRGGGVRNLTAREVARQVYGESGVRGFYRGFGISVLQFAPTSAVSCA